MFEKKGSYVNRGNKQIQEGNTPLAWQTVIEGLNYYQGKALKAFNPYPVADAALVVVALRSFADSIEKANPTCEPLVQDLQNRLKAPDITHTEKFHKTK